MGACGIVVNCMGNRWEMFETAWEMLEECLGNAWVGNARGTLRKCLSDDWELVGKCLGNTWEMLGKSFGKTLRNAGDMLEWMLGKC
jgi:hypothetical protein